MATTTVRISQQTHDLLKELAKSLSLPLQTLVEQAVLSYQRELDRQRVHQEIVRFAEAAAGTDWDLDEELEQAALDELKSLP